MPATYDAIKTIHDFPSLVTYLHDNLDWPLDYEDIEDLTFEYAPKELGLEPQHVVKLHSIKQLRPLTNNQPWGVFYLEFEPKRLPVVVLRRILRELVPKKRQSASASERAVWNRHDLLFISSMGEQSHRRISFAHFADGADGLPTLQTFDWDETETQLYAIGLAIEKLKWPANEANTAAWREEWASAFTKPHRYSITTAKELSLALAELAGRTRDIVKAIYAVEANDAPLHALYTAFQKALVHDLTPAGFADTIAQTIAYGLFAARAETGKLLGLQNLANMVPHTNPFLRELFREIEKLGGAKDGQINFDELGVVALIETLNKADMGLVLEDFGRQTGGGREDPVIHFYEAFLGEYDKQQKVERGVFYTPKPVVSFIVRSVDAILREQFACPDGLADTSTWAEVAARLPGIQIPQGIAPETPFVQLLDPATGTGTFLETVIEVIHESLTLRWTQQRLTATQRRAAWNEYVPKHLLPRLHGFELMMASYAIAHVKLGLALRQRGYDFQSGERLRVYLTNTLEPPTQGEEQLAFLPEFLSHEASAADRIKRHTPITVVVGNPPYSGLSANLTASARALVERYKYVDGLRLQEKGALQFEKNLQDDYVKFFAWSERTATASRVGVLSLITNNGYIDTPTLRGMRWNIMQSFDQIHLYNLHGSTKQPMAADKNVFDIQQGVAICIAARNNSHRASECKILRSDLIGSRELKYQILRSSSIQQTKWERIVPSSPHYRFVATDEVKQSEYDKYTSLTQIMPFYSSGTETGFDALLVDFTQDELLGKISTFLDPYKSDEDVRAQFSAGEGTAKKLLDKRTQFRADFDQNGRKYLVQGMYRLFDNRFYYYKKEYLKTNSFKVMENLISHANIALVAFRQQSQDGFHHIFATCKLGDKNAVSLRTREINYYFPLRVFPPSSLSRPNYNVDFIEEVEARTGLKFHDASVALPGRSDKIVVSFEDTSIPSLGMFTEYHGLFTQAEDNKAVTWTERGNTFTPEDVFHYAYSVFHAPSYRARYSEFLKIDFPRLPLTSDVALFRVLCSLGEQLVGLHLMERTGPNTAGFPVTGSNVMDAPRYTEPGQGAAEGRVWINRAQYFAPVSSEVWEFQIGGYQVCHKWLKDRKGRTLSPEDVAHYGKIVAALDETIRLMQAIDEVIEEHGGWPLQ